MTKERVGIEQNMSWTHVRKGGRKLGGESSRKSEMKLIQGGIILLRKMGLQILTSDFHFFALQVSLDSRVREIINRNMIAPSQHTFDEAHLQIYTLMHRDSYPRFVNSPVYKNLLRTSGAVSDTANTNS